MTNKKKLNLASTQANNSIAEIPERREKIKAQVQFRNQLLEFQKRFSYQNEFDRLQGAKKINSITARCKISNERFTEYGSQMTKR